MRLVALAVMTLALAGCASTVEVPGNPTGDELDRLLELELDFQWQYVGLPPDDPRPPVDVVRFVSSEEAADVYRECMIEAGYENFNLVVGAIYGGASIEQRVAIYTCTAMYPKLPSTYGLFSEAQLDYLYDHYTEVTIPCIESTGVSVGEVPSREQFVKPPSYLFDTWVPYRQLDGENGYLSSINAAIFPRAFLPSDREYQAHLVRWLKYMQTHRIMKEWENPMQFGIFTVSDVTTDPTDGSTPTEGGRIKAIVTIAKKAEEVGLDVFALGEHHNPPFVSSSPTTTLAFIAAQTSKLILSTSTTLITTNDPVKIAEDHAMLQHLADGRTDLMMGRGNTGPVYPWFGKDIRDGIELAIENYALLHRLWTEDFVDWSGKFRTPLQGFQSTPRPLDGVPPFVWHGSIRSPEIAEQAAYYGDGFFANNIFWPKEHYMRLIGYYRERFEHYGHGTAEQAIVGLGGQAFMRAKSQDAVAEFRPYFDNAPVYGHGPSMEDFTEQTPLTVGSPQQVIDRYAGMREHFGDYQRQLFLMDHAGLPLKTVLEQLDMLGEEVVPVLRKEFAKNRPASVPEGPTHAARVAALRVEPVETPVVK